MKKLHRQPAPAINPGLGLNTKIHSVDANFSLKFPSKVAFCCPWEITGESAEVREVTTKKMKSTKCSYSAGRSLAGWLAGSRNYPAYTITLPLPQIIIHADVNTGALGKHQRAQPRRLPALINSYELQFATRPQLKTFASECDK